MANIPLQSISFPGLSDKYTTPAVDATLTQTGAAADAKKTGDEIASLKNDLTNGTFPVGNAENADQLTSTVGIEDNAPYLFRTSGGSNDIGDREDVRKIVGGTVVNNQLLSNGNFASASGWRIYDSTKGSLSVSDGIATLSYTTAGNGGYAYGLCLTQSPLTSETGHKFFASSQVKIDFPGKVKYEIGTGITNPEMLIEQNKWVEASVVCNKENSGTTVMLKPLDADIVSGSTMQVKSFMITDLTKDFGTAIADYAYSLETATAGAGVAWLKKHFPAQFDSGYQAYDAGSLQSVSGLTEHKMVGFNQWDEETELGEYNISTGAKQTASGKICASNYISVLPDTTYYVKTPSAVTLLFYDANKEYLSYVGGKQNATFTTPTNAHFMTFGCSSAYGATYNHDICINLHWDGEKDGTYEPYKTWSYALDDSVTLRGIPKVDANGNLYYDGDEYLPDGTVNRRYGIVDLGTLTWVYDSTKTRFYTGGIKTEIKPVSNNSLVGDMVCSAYIPAAINSMASLDKAIFVDTTGMLYVKNLAYSDAATFKTAMSGVYLVYELATPTTETALPYQATQIVDDWGTEEYVLADGAYPVPVGHNTMYQNNLRAKLEMSPDSPDGDGLYVVQQESGENTYVPLASTATIQDILTRLTALENA